MVVYKITNTVNGKIYIGKTKWALEKRWRRHQVLSRTKKHQYLYDAMRCYGIENFVVEALEECQDEKQLNERERHWIKLLGSTDSKVGYNLTAGGDGGRQPDHILAKISATRTGQKMAEETKRKISEANKGHPPHPMTAEIKEKIRQTFLRKGFRPPINRKGNIGYRHTEETKAILRQKQLARKGKHHSAEQKAEFSRRWSNGGCPTYVHIDKDELGALIKQGLYAKDIAKALGISFQTVFAKIRKYFRGTLVEARRKLCGS